MLNFKLFRYHNTVSSLCAEYNYKRLITKLALLSQAKPRLKGVGIFLIFFYVPSISILPQQLLPALGIRSKYMPSFLTRLSIFVVWFMVIMVTCVISSNNENMELFDTY